MNRLKWSVVGCLVALVGLSAPVRAGSVAGASVTVYNSGRSLVKETRTVNLPKGMASVVFKDIPVTMDSTSVQATAEDMVVHDLQYSFLPITQQNLLDRYIGRELSVILPDPADANARILRKATLLSNVDSPVFLVGNEVYVGKYEAVLLPELPAGLQQEPTLTLTTENASAAKRNVLLSYLMGGLTWRADYALTLNGAGDRAAIDAWATVENTSGRGFTGADLKLVAGDVQQAASPRRNFQAKAVMMESDMVAASAPSEESFAQYHVYSVDRPVDLAESGTKQLSLFSAPALAVSQDLVSRFHAGNVQYGDEMKQNVEFALSFANTEKNGLGRLMPGGVVRVFMPTSDGSLLLAGEARMGHVGAGGEVKLALGQSFDISVARTQSSFKKLGKNAYEMSWKIAVVNGSGTAQRLKLKDSYSGEWQVMTADKPYTTPDAGSLEFDLSVPPSVDGAPFVVKYTVQVTD